MRWPLTCVPCVGEVHTTPHIAPHLKCGLQGQLANPSISLQTHPLGRGSAVHEVELLGGEIGCLLCNVSKALLCGPSNFSWVPSLQGPSRLCTPKRPGYLKRTDTNSPFLPPRRAADLSILTSRASQFAAVLSLTFIK